MGVYDISLGRRFTIFQISIPSLLRTRSNSAEHRDQCPNTGAGENQQDQRARPNATAAKNNNGRGNTKARNRAQDRAQDRRDN